VATFSISSDTKKDKKIDEAIVYTNYFYDYFKRVIYDEGHYIKISIRVNPDRFAYPQPLTNLQNSKTLIHQVINLVKASYI
jgi:hypothetical protein